MPAFLQAADKELSRGYLQFVDKLYLYRYRLYTAYIQLIYRLYTGYLADFCEANKY
jgi:hypothetical protein